MGITPAAISLTVKPSSFAQHHREPSNAPAAAPAGIRRASGTNEAEESMNNTPTSIITKKRSRSKRADDLQDEPVEEKAAAVAAPAPVDTAPPSFTETPADAPAPAEPGDRSMLKLYLQEIAKTPLLTIADEIALAKRIKRGD